MNNSTARTVQGAVRIFFHTLLVVCFFTFPHFIVAAGLGSAA